MDCPHIPELEYGEFSQRLHHKVAGQRIPISGSLELTFRCNLRCVHCYVAHGHQGLPGQEELSYAELRGIFDQVVDAGCLWLLLTGGEPLLRPDALDIYRYAKQKGLLITLFTNGTLITPAVADTLAEWRPFSIEITLYGRTQETYERVTGIPGSHARCMRGIELLLERGLPLKLKTMLLTLNKHELADMQAYAAGLGVSFRFDPLVNAGMDASKAPVAYRLPPEEVVAFELADPVRRERWPTHYDKRYGTKVDLSKLYVCSAGQNSFQIDPYGKLNLCMVARIPGYDLRQGSFIAGWQRALPEAYAMKASPNYECGGCQLRALCAQCPAWANLEHGDPEKRVDYLCQVTYLRAEAFSGLTTKQTKI